MPFMEPYITTRCLTRYRIVEMTDDFILQEHRYSLRKSRHYFWARIVFRHSKPTLKVAQAVDVQNARKREWRFVKEDLLANMPQSIKELPPGNDERTQWLMDKIVKVKRQLGDDDVETDGLGDDNSCADLDEEENYFDNDCPWEDSMDSVVNSDTISTFGKDAVRKYPAASTTECVDSDTQPEQMTSTPHGSNKGSRFNFIKKLSRDKEKRMGANDTATGSGSASAIGREVSTRPRLGLDERITGYNSDQEMSDARKPFLSPGPLTLHQHRRQSSVPEDLQTSKIVSHNAGLSRSAAAPKLRNRALLAQSSSEGHSNRNIIFTSRDTPLEQVHQLARFSSFPSSLYSSVRNLLGSSCNNPTETDSNGLPAYLTALPISSDSHQKEKVTIEKLKCDHETRSAFKAVGAVSTGAVLMRAVTFDAWFILLIFLNIGVVYAVRKRHTLAKEFIKGSVKRRVKFTKQVWNARWTRNPKTSKHVDKDGPETNSSTTNSEKDSLGSVDDLPGPTSVDALKLRKLASVRLSSSGSVSNDL